MASPDRPVIAEGRAAAPTVKVKAHKKLKRTEEDGRMLLYLIAVVDDGCSLWKDETQSGDSSPTDSVDDCPC